MRMRVKGGERVSLTSLQKTYSSLSGSAANSLISLFIGKGLLQFLFAPKRSAQIFQLHFGLTLDYLLALCFSGQ